MDSFNVKRHVCKMLRYQMKCPVIALEAQSQLLSYGDSLADVLAIDRKRTLIEVEVKISMADFRADAQKTKHQFYRQIMGMPYKLIHQTYFGQDRTMQPKSYPTGRFYFAVPKELANAVKLECDQLYPYAGVISVSDNGYRDGTYLSECTLIRDAHILQKKKLSLLETAQLAKSQSATICRLMDKLAGMPQQERNIG